MLVAHEIFPVLRLTSGVIDVVVVVVVIAVVWFFVWYGVSRVCSACARYECVCERSHAFHIVCYCEYWYCMLLLLLAAFSANEQ